MIVKQADGGAVSVPPSLHFLIGQNDCGQWLAVESHGLMGGLFKSQADAIHFATFESGSRAGAFDLSPTPLSLSFTAANA